MTILMILFFTFNNTLDTYDNAEQAIYSCVKSHGGHPMTKSYEKRYNTARRLVNGSHRGGLPWELPAAVAKFESSFRYDVIARDGKGSRGVMQLHGESLRYCRRKEGRKISMKNKDDQFICGSHWLKYAIDKCGGRIDRGLARYATGYMCDYRESKSVSGIVKRRMKLFKKLVDNFGKRKDP